MTYLEALIFKVVSIFDFVFIFEVLLIFEGEGGLKKIRHWKLKAKTKVSAYFHLIIPERY